MVDVFSENLLSLAQVAKLLPPGRQGRPVNFSTIYRWIFTGIKSPTGERVKLGSIRLGGRYLVSRESLQRFIDALSARPGADATEPIRTPSARKKASEVAKKKLEKLGI
jgi:hypothetical protein